METSRYKPVKDYIVPHELTEKHPQIKRIRGEHLLVRSHNLTDNPITQQAILTEREADVERWKKLGSFQGIHLPQFTTEVEPDINGNLFFHIIIEEIDGQNLEESSFNQADEKFKLSVVEMIKGLVAYSEDIFENRGGYVSDQNLSQYVYGKGEDGLQKIYFVDLGTEGHFLPPTKGHHDANSYFFARYMPLILEMIEGLEKKIREPLVDSRITMAKFLNRTPQGTGGISYARSLKELVLQERLPET